jgi:hypothetical protein
MPLANRIRNGWDIKTGVLSLTGPVQRGIEMRVERVLLLSLHSLGVCIRQPHRRIIQPLFVLVFILLDRLLPGISV